MGFLDDFMKTVVKGGDLPLSPGPNPGSAASAGANLGNVDWLGVLGLGLSGLGSIGNIVTQLILGNRQATQAHMDMRRWERMRQPVAETYNTIFNAPGVTGATPPFGDWRTAYQWAPNQAMEQMYSNYLNRTYGVPSNVAQTQVSQALQPTRIGRLPSQMISPAAIGQSLMGSQQYQPGTMAQSLLGTKVPALTSQLDYLKNAAELSTFNLWRAQQLPNLIG